MSWFFFALLGPLLWPVANFSDKYIISKYFRGKQTGSLVLFTSITGLLAALVILSLKPEVVFLPLQAALIVSLAGALFVSAFIPYLHALDKAEASVVSPLYQLIPVFGYLLGFFILDEHLPARQIIGGVIVIAGSVLLSFDLSGAKIIFKKSVFWPMVLSSFVIALSFLLFKLVAVGVDFWASIFWEYIGMVVFGFLLVVFFRGYRQDFLSTLQANTKVVLSLNVFSEIFNIVAKLATNFATLLAPLALVLVVNSFQPLVTLVYGIMLTLLFPHIIKEDIQLKTITHKLVSILLIILGSYFLI